MLILRNANNEKVSKRIFVESCWFVCKQMSESSWKSALNESSNISKHQHIKTHQHISHFHIFLTLVAVARLITHHCKYDFIFMIAFYDWRRDFTQFVIMTSKNIKTSNVQSLRISRFKLRTSMLSICHWHEIATHNLQRQQRKRSFRRVWLSERFSRELEKRISSKRTCSLRRKNSKHQDTTSRAISVCWSTAAFYCWWLFQRWHYERYASIKSRSSKFCPNSHFDVYVAKFSRTCKNAQRRLNACNHRHLKQFKRSSKSFVWACFKIWLLFECLTTRNWRVIITVAIINHRDRVTLQKKDMRLVDEFMRHYQIFDYLVKK